MSEREHLAPRGAMAPSVEPYRTAGPFNEASLPDALKGTHRLKPGVWGLLDLSEGTVAFCWDDDEGGRHSLAAPASVTIPPEVPHHLEVSGPLRLTVTFHR